MATCAPQSLMTNGAAFAVKNAGELEVLQTQLLAEILLALDPMADTSPQALMTAGKAFAALPGGMLQIVQTQLLCEILAAGGTGGVSIATTGHGDPTEAATVEPSIYVDLDTNRVWWFFNGAWN